MRWQNHVGDDGAINKILTQAFRSRILIGTDIGVGPAVEAAFADGGEEVGNEIVAEMVAFLDAGPEFSRLGGEFQADGIAKARREDFLGCAVRMKTQNG